jgi:lariat debranching enzyme
LGNAGSVLVNGLRISGASGIYKSHDYYKGEVERPSPWLLELTDLYSLPHLGFFETLPYDRSTLRSCYHIRHYSVTKLMLLPPSPTPSNSPAQESLSPFPPSTHPSIFLSHDWPLSIAPHGDLPGLLRRKPFFADEIRDNTLGSKPLLEVLKVLRPKWWFAAHLHVKFAALWKHGESGQKRVEPAPKKVEKVKNPDEIDLDDDDQAESAPTPPPVSNPDEISLDDDDDVPSTLAVDAAADKAEVVETAELVRDAVETNPDEIMLDDDEDEEPAGHRHHPKEASTSANASTSLPPRPPQQVEIVQSGTRGEEGITRFLALDKCMPNKDFLQVRFLAR